MDASWLVPEWPAPPNVRAVCTTREGGVSLGRYESLNLGDHVGDEPAHVADNRNRLRASIGARPVFLQQVHGTGVVELDAAQSIVRDGTAADGCTATVAGLACTIMVADCLPVLFTDEAGHRVAAAHAGWRGLAGGVLEQTARAFDGASGVIAWLGPCIGPKAFEVGAEVKAAFEAHAPEAASCFRTRLLLRNGAITGLMSSVSSGMVSRYRMIPAIRSGGSASGGHGTGPFWSQNGVATASGRIVVTLIP